MCEAALGIHCNFAGFTTICDESVANTSPLEYQKSLQCWKTMTILSYAIYPFYVESIGFLIKVIYVKKPLYHINGLLVIIYHGHNVKWQPYCKHPNILIVYDIKFTFLKFGTYHLFPESSVATLKQRIGVLYSPWRPSWEMVAILKTTKQYLLLSITLKLHSICAYQFQRIILFHCLLLFSIQTIVF